MNLGVKNLYFESALVMDTLGADMFLEGLLRDAIERECGDRALEARCGDAPLA